MTQVVRIAATIIQLAFVVQSYNMEQAVNSSTEVRMADELANKLINKLIGNGNDHFQFGQLDGTTLGKAGQFAVPTQSKLVPQGTMKAKFSNTLTPSLHSTRPSHFQNQQRRMWLGAVPSGQGKFESVRASQAETLTRPNQLSPETKRFEVTKPMGLVLEDVSQGTGAKIAEIAPDGKAAKVGGMKEEMRLVSINGVPCKHESFDHIMTVLSNLNPNAPIQLEMGIADVTKEVSVDSPNAEPLSVRVDCAPEESSGDQCDISFAVQLTLEPCMAQVVRWKKARSVEGQPVMMVESLPKNSEAYRRGMRPGMVVKTMSGGAGRTIEEVVNMENLRGINMRNFQDFFRVARYPITFVMREGVKIGSERNIAAKDVRIARAHARREEIKKIDEMRMDAGRDFPLVGMLFSSLLLPPSVLLALNFVFGWYTGDGYGH